MKIFGWLMTLIGGWISFVAVRVKENALDTSYSSTSWKTPSQEDIMEEVATSNTVLTVGIIIAVIGILILITRYIGENKSSHVQTRCCLRCGKISDIDKRFCANCGNDLSAQGNNDME